MVEDLLLETGDLAEASHAALDLLEWLNNGGFYPAETNWKDLLVALSTLDSDED